MVRSNGNQRIPVRVQQELILLRKLVRLQAAKDAAAVAPQQTQSKPTQALNSFGSVYKELPKLMNAPQRSTAHSRRLSMMAGMASSSSEQEMCEFQPPGPRRAPALARQEDPEQNWGEILLSSKRARAGWEASRAADAARQQEMTMAHAAAEAQTRPNVIPRPSHSASWDAMIRRAEEEMLAAQATYRALTEGETQCSSSSNPLLSVPVASARREELCAKANQEHEISSAHRAAIRNVIRQRALVTDRSSEVGIQANRIGAEKNVDMKYWQAVNRPVAAQAAANAYANTPAAASSDMSARRSNGHSRQSSAFGPIGSKKPVAKPQEDARLQSALFVLPLSMRHGLHPNVVRSMASRPATPARHESPKNDLPTVHMAQEYQEFGDYKPWPSHDAGHIGQTSGSALYQADGSLDYTTASLRESSNTGMHQDLSTVPPTMRLPTSTTAYAPRLVLDNNFSRACQEAYGNRTLGIGEEDIIPTHEALAARYERKIALLRDQAREIQTEHIEDDNADEDEYPHVHNETHSASMSPWGLIDTVSQTSPMPSAYASEAYKSTPEEQSQVDDFFVADVISINPTAAYGVTTAYVEESQYFEQADDWEAARRDQTSTISQTPDFDLEAWKAMRNTDMRRQADFKVTSSEESTHRNGWPIGASRPLTRPFEGVAPRVRPELSGNKSGFTTPSPVSTKSSRSNPDKESMVFHFSP